MRWPMTRPSSSRTASWERAVGAFIPAEPVYWARAGAAATSVAVAMSAKSARCKACGMGAPEWLGALTRGSDGRSIVAVGGRHPGAGAGHGQAERFEEVAGRERAAE